MFKEIQAPYLTPSPDILSVTPWFLREDDSLDPLPDRLASWTQGCDITLTRTVSIDRKLLLESTSLPPESRFDLAVTFSSAQTKLKMLAYRQTFVKDELSLFVTLSGDQIGGDLQIRTTLILGEGQPAPKPWIASRAGSIFLEEKHSVTLEGSGSTFPVGVLDFASSTYPINASWFLESSCNMEARFSSAFRLMVNERDVDLLRAIRSTRPTSSDILLLSQFKGEVLSSLLQFSYRLQTEGILEVGEHSKGSVGYVLSSLVEETGSINIDIPGDITDFFRHAASLSSLSRSFGMDRGF